MVNLTFAQYENLQSQIANLNTLAGIHTQALQELAPILESLVNRLADLEKKVGNATA